MASRIEVGERDAVWTAPAERRWRAYHEERVDSVTCAEVMARFRRS